LSIKEFNINISPDEAMNKITEGVIKGTISGKLVDFYERFSGEHQIMVFVLEKFFMRTSNRSSMTVTIDNFGDVTKVHAVASGSSESPFFRFDWGAGDSFANSVENALAQHIIS
jgi:hypothetical protein